MGTDSKQNILSLWFIWHFFEMPRFLLGVWKNYILFALNYFSLPGLLRSLFAPWRRYKWNYPKSFDIAEFFSTLFSNAFSRLLGALVRVVLIAVGIAFQIFVIVAGFTVLLLWVIIPFIIVAGILFVFVY